jgi:hypothetical protein
VCGWVKCRGWATRPAAVAVQQSLFGYISFHFSAESRCWAKSQLGYIKSPAGRKAWGTWWSNKTRFRTLWTHLTANEIIHMDVNFHRLNWLLLLFYFLFCFYRPSWNDYIVKVPAIINTFLSYLNCNQIPLNNYTSSLLISIRGVYTATRRCIYLEFRYLQHHQEGDVKRSNI